MFSNIGAIVSAMFGNYTKLAGSIVGAGLGYAVSHGLPVSMATPEIQTGLTALGAAVLTWAFPANKPK